MRHYNLLIVTTSPPSLIFAFYADTLRWQILRSFFQLFRDLYLLKYTLYLNIRSFSALKSWQASPYYVRSNGHVYMGAERSYFFRWPTTYVFPRISEV